jgi:hypothetical protein
MSAITAARGSTDSELSVVDSAAPAVADGEDVPGAEDVAGGAPAVAGGA